MPAAAEVLIVRAERKLVKVRLSLRGSVWHYRFWWRGREYFRSTGTGVLRHARAAAQDAVLAAASCASPEKPLESVCTSYISTRWPGDLNSTGSDHQVRLRGWYRWADGAVLPADLDAATALVQRYVDHRRRERVSAVTIHNDVRAIHRALTWAMKAGLYRWTVNPAAAIRLDLEPAPRSEPPAVDLAAVQDTLRRAQGSDLEPILLLAYGAGLRPVECHRMRRQDVILGDCPQVRTTAKGRTVQVPLVPWTADRLRAWMDAHPGAPDTPLFPASKWTMHRRMRALTGRTLTLNPLRGLHSTLLFEAGALPSEESRRLRHSTRVAEERYVRWQQLRDRSGLSARVSDILSGGAGEGTTGAKTGASWEGAKPTKPDA